MFKFNNKETRTMPMASFWCLYRYLWAYFTPCSGVSIVNFKQVNAGLHTCGFRILKLAFQSECRMPWLHWVVKNKLWWKFLLLKIRVTKNGRWKHCRISSWNVKKNKILYSRLRLMTNLIMSVSKYKIIDVWFYY